MLEGLDKIDWSKLSHAYGEANDVPDMLRALAFGDDEARSRAQSSLWGNLYHQGTVYEATAYAIPFFLEMLEGDVPEKDFLLTYLAYVSHGTSYHDVHQSFYDEDEKDAEFFEQMKSELYWVAEVQKNAVKGLPIYTRLLADGDTNTRVCAAYLLSALTTFHPQSIDPLYDQLSKESEPRVKACLILGLRSRERSRGDYPKTLLTMFDNSATTLVKLASALAILKLETTRSPKPIIQFLTDVIVDPGDLEKEFDTLPWAEGGVRHHAAQALCYLGSEAKFVLPTLLEFFTSRKPGCLAVAEDIAYIAFGDKPFPSGTKATDLSAEQRQVLQAILDVQPPNTTYGNLTDIFEMYNLPNTNEKMRDFLRIEQWLRKEEP